MRVRRVVKKSVLGNCGEPTLVYTDTMGKLRFKKEEDPGVDSSPESTDSPWIVLVADDEGDVHMVTKLVLKNFRFEGKAIKILPSKSGAETLRVLEEHPNVAVMLLDVVMESQTAGLDVVEKVRGDLANHEVRIILRSGQPGYANVSKVINQYDVNEFKRKEHLTDADLRDTVLLALRSYRDIQAAKNRESEVP